MRQTIIAALIVLMSANAAPGGVIYTTVSQGVTGTNLAAAPPGTPFALDYRPFIAAPYDAKEVHFIFDGNSTAFTDLRIRLDSSDTVFSFLPAPPSNQQIAYKLYDPSLTTNPGPGYPTTPVFVPITQEWRDELADGVLSGTLWVNNASNSPSNYLFSAGVTFAVPEPACGFAIILAALTLCRRRRFAGD
jgi:hypothetical protein